jgi:carbonic anhydrase
MRLVVCVLLALVAVAAARSRLHLRRATPDGHQEAINPAGAGEYGGHTEAPHAAGGHFGYEQGGSDWGGTCSSGQHQSPINIDSNLEVKPGNIRFEYQAAKGLKIKNTGHTVQVDGNGQLGRLKLMNSINDTVIYDLKQFHLHCPSEHTKDGQHFDCEIHFVHQKQGSSGKSDLLVVGILLSRAGCASNDGCGCSGCGCGSTSFLSTVFAGVPKDANTEAPIEGVVDPSNFIKSHMFNYFTYQGSLTTPTCDETVFWHVGNGIATIPEGVFQIFNRYLWAGNKEFSASGHGNNRNVQNLNGRTVSRWRYTPPMEVEAHAVDSLAAAHNNCN